MPSPKPLIPNEGWRRRLFIIIYRADTPAGKWFDLLLIASILISVITVMLGTVNWIHRRYADALTGLEWFFTALFTIEYILRIVCIEKPHKYIFSFYGVVDLLSIAPTYLNFLIAGSHSFLVIRTLRLLRIFRILKLMQYVVQINILMKAVAGSRHKITVFLFFICTIVVIFGSIMYLVEGPTNGFTSIPRSIYWAIVTMTTVGYGDISPKTDLGQGLAAIVMVLGYSVIAVPTGIFSAELNRAIQSHESDRTCGSCGKKGHESVAVFCNVCGNRL
ncbi:MAG: ion transporter [Gammaproteobacteria bacterium]